VLLRIVSRFVKTIFQLSSFQTSELLTRRETFWRNLKYGRFRASRQGHLRAFNRESINQQNTVIKGMFSTNKYDQEQGQQALLGGGNVPDKIYDHPIGKPNNYDPVYNPDPRLPDAPTNLNGDKNKPTSTNSTYLYIGGALIVLFVLLKK